MSSLRRSSRRGTALIEFTLTGIPLIFLTVSTVAVALDMWQYSMLTYAVETTARYVTFHGASCTQNGNTCGTTVGNVATFFKKQALGANSQVTLTLTDTSGSTTCSSPFTSCMSSVSAFPATTANGVGNDITVQATYAFNNPMAMFWRGNATFNLGVTSTQRIVF
jgi:Flp pilus assembly protein TadG